MFIYFLSDYLLSNNHINAIIVHKFDFSDEEVGAWFYELNRPVKYEP